MKKKILSTAFAVMIMAVAGYNVYVNQTKSNLSDLALANIEALADDKPEGGNGESTIQGKCNKSDIIIAECKVFCPRCEVEWHPKPRVFKATVYDVSGSCACGYSNWEHYNN